jgi:hypothetical protein
MKLEARCCVVRKLAVPCSRVLVLATGARPPARALEYCRYTCTPSTAHSAALARCKQGACSNRLGLENVLCPIAPLGLSIPAMVTALFWHTVVAAAVSVAFGWTPVLHSDAGPPQFVVVVSLARGASTMVVRTIRALLYAGLAVECSRSQELTELISVAYLLARRLPHCLEFYAPVMAKLLRLPPPPPLPPTPPPLPPPPRHTAGTINTKATAPRHSTTTPPGRSDRFPPVLDVVQRAVRPRSFPDRCV